MSQERENEDDQETVTLFQLKLINKDKCGWYELAILNEYNSSYMLAQASKTAQIAKDIRRGRDISVVDISTSSSRLAREMSEEEIRDLAARYIPKYLRGKFQIDHNMPPVTVPVVRGPGSGGLIDTQKRTEEWVRADA